MAVWREGTSGVLPDNAVEERRPHAHSGNINSSPSLWWMAGQK
jgi:hypothetical protein